MNTRQNRIFYEQLPTGEFTSRYVPIANLENCPDLQHMRTYLAHAQSITEIGSGEGRVIQWLLDHTQATIFGIERCSHFFSTLYTKFNSNKRVTLIKGDAVRQKIPKTDLVIFPWSVIMEFSPYSQTNIIKKILNQGSTVIVDFPSNPKRRKHTSITSTQGNTITGTFPDIDKFELLGGKISMYYARKHRRIQYAFTATP